MWGINYRTSDANLAILFMYVTYTANSLLNTVKWELSNRIPLEIDILSYSGNIDLNWIKRILKCRDDIKVNIFLFNNKIEIDNKQIDIINIPKKINTYGGAYNYIISKVQGKYFMLLDNLDYLNPEIFNKIIIQRIIEKKLSND